MSAYSLADTNLFAYCGNNPVTSEDDDGKLAHYVVTALVGGLIGGVVAAATEMAVQKACGGEIDGAAVASAYIGGVFAGALSAIPGIPDCAADVVGSAVRTASYGLLTKQSADEIVRNTATAAISSLTIGRMNQYLKTGALRSTKTPPVIKNLLYKGRHFDTTSPKAGLRQSLNNTGKSAFNSFFQNTTKFRLTRQFIL